MGDTIPADGPLSHRIALQTAEAALTGVSQPVSKETVPISGDAEPGDRHSMCFTGTAATCPGRGTAVVTATGMQTEMGQIAGMLSKAPVETTSLQKEQDRVGKLLGVIVVVMIAPIRLVEEVRGISALFEVLILDVALAVAAVPEGLPAVMTAMLALGLQRMATRKSNFRHLAAVETLGSATLIASDKTGTLTRNEMTLRSIVTASGRVSLGGTGYEPIGEIGSRVAGGIGDLLPAECRRELTVADRADNAASQESNGRWTVKGDPTEGAADCRGTQGRPRGQNARHALRERRGGALLLRAQVDDDGPHRRRATGTPARLHQGCLGYPALALLAGTRRRKLSTLEGRAADGDTGREPGDRRPCIAHAGRRRS